MTCFDKALDFFNKGGPVMWPLLLSSLLALTLAIERAIYFLRLHFRINDPLLKKIVVLADQGKFDEALGEGEKSKDPAIKMLVKGLKQRDHGLSDAMMVEAERNLDSMKRGLGIMDTLVSIAPLLGILGTVTGVIRSFHVLGDATLQDPRVAISGISEALITTAAGLSIALLTLIPLNYFSVVASRYARRLEHSATKFEVCCRRGGHRNGK